MLMSFDFHLANRKQVIMYISAYLLLTLPVYFQRQMYILLDLASMGSWDMVLLFLKLRYQSP